jgi:hypothetical protein
LLAGTRGFFPSVFEWVFHVKSCVFAAFSFIVFRYLLVAFITELLDSSSFSFLFTQQPLDQSRNSIRFRAHAASSAGFPENSKGSVHTLMQGRDEANI